MCNETCTNNGVILRITATKGDRDEQRQINFFVSPCEKEKGCKLTHEEEQHESGDHLNSFETTITKTTMAQYPSLSRRVVLV